MENPFKQAKELKKKLELSELRFRAVAQTATDGIIITDQYSNILFANLKAFEMFGYSEEELLGSNLSRLMPEKYRTGHQKGIERFLTTRTPKLIGHTVEVEGLKKDATEFPIELSLSYWEEENKAYFTGIIRDITSRKKTLQELELLQSIITEVVKTNDFLAALEVSLRKICQSLDWDYGEAWIAADDQQSMYFAPVCYSKTDSVKEFIEESKKINIGFDEGMRMKVFKESKAVWNPDASDPARGLYRAPLAKKANLKACLSVPIRSENRVIASILFFKHTYEEENIHVKNIITSIADQLGILLQRIRTEEALRQSEAKFRLLAENSTDMIARLKPDGTLLYVSPSSELLVGFKPEELIGKNAFEFYHPDDLELMRKAYANVVEIPEIATVRYRTLRKDGTYIWVESTGRNIKNDKGEIIEIHGATRDISQTKEAEEALKQSEEALRKINTELENKVAKRTAQLEKQKEDIYSVLMQAPAMIALGRGPELTFELANPLYLKVVGRTSEIIGKSVLEVFPEIKGQPVYDILMNVFKTGERFIGSEVLVKLDTNNDGIEENLYFNFVYEPVRNSKGEVNGILTHAIEVTNQVHARKQLEESEERFRTLADNIPNLAWMAYASGAVFWYNKRWYEYTGTTPEQMEGWGWQSVHDPEELPSVLERWKASIETGKRFDMVFPLKGADGMFRPFLTRVVPIKDNDGNIIRWFGTNTDVSEVENKNKELQKINNDLDNFIYTASHDLKAPVSNIEGLLNTMLDSLSEESKNNDDFKAVFALMEKSIARFKTTILDLTEITKVQKQSAEDIETINCSEIIDDVKFLIQDKINEAGALVNIDTSECNSWNFSRKNFHSIVYNLLSNAIKYRDPQRPLEIAISTRNQDKYVVLIVQDNGLGISSANKEKMFTMFKRFHDHVEGTGIGLYIVKRIIENAGGRIEVESEVGKGSIFKVFFRT